jgi:hypothetical protein
MSYLLEELSNSEFVRIQVYFGRGEDVDIGLLNLGADVSEFNGAFRKVDAVQVNEVESGAVGRNLGLERVSEDIIGADRGGLPKDRSRLEKGRYSLEV